jgi:hypothetical protein
MCRFRTIRKIGASHPINGRKGTSRPSNGRGVEKYFSGPRKGASSRKKTFLIREEVLTRQPPVGRAEDLPRGIPPSQRPPGRDACLRDLFANKKLLFAKRLSGGAWKYFWNLPPAGWAGGPRPHAFRPINGQEVPIFPIFPNRHIFSNFIF